MTIVFSSKATKKSPPKKLYPKHPPFSINFITIIACLVISNDPRVTFLS